MKPARVDTSVLTTGGLLRKKEEKTALTKSINSSQSVACDVSRDDWIMLVKSSTYIPDLYPTDYATASSLSYLLRPSCWETGKAQMLNW